MRLLLPAGRIDTGGVGTHRRTLRTILMALVPTLLVSSLVFIDSGVPAVAAPHAFALFDDVASAIAPAGETLTFAAFGDYGWSDDGNEQAVADIVDAKDVDLIITTGDNTYGSSIQSPATSTIDYNIGKSYAGYIGDYAGAYGPGSPTNRFFPAPGNHDYTDGDGIAAYLAYFTLPGAGITTSGTSGSELYYDFVEGPVHFFALDSDVGQPGVDPDAQKAWLQAQLAASTARWKVVYFHHAAFSSSTHHGSNIHMQWPFEAWGADAVLAGHDHVYERILRDDNADGTDLVYLTTGAGGMSLYSFGAAAVPGSQVRYSDNYGTVIAAADSNSLTFEFWSITGGGTLIDSYTLGAPSPPPSEWVAYNDMNTIAGGPNPAHVTSHTYQTSAGVLKDYASGAVLPVTVTGTTVGGFDTFGNGGPVSNPTSDASAAFDGIVDLTGTDELDAAGWASTLTFNGLSPSQEYSVTLSANRDSSDYTGNRFAQVTIDGIDAATAASSSGVIVNSPTSVSFSVGDNSANGYVAKWVNIDPGSDGSFTVTSTWDDTRGTVPAGTAPNTKGYAMSAFKLEATDRGPGPAAPGTPVIAVSVASDRTSAVVTWADVSEETSYQVWSAKTINGPFAKVGPDLPANSTSASVPIVPTDPLCIRVDASNGVGISPSNVVCIPAGGDSYGLVDPGTGIWTLTDVEGDSKVFYYGNPGDVPLAGDWNCDGTDTPGLYRQSDGYVYLRNSNTQGVADRSFYFGDPGDTPLAGDFNGDGCDTVSLYRPSEARFYVINTLGSGDTGLGAAELSYIFGDPGDTPFAGDFDGDGIDTFGLYRTSSGLMYYRNSHTQGVADYQFYYGNPDDRFVSGDWNANGVSSPGVFRPSNRTVYLKYQNTQGNADRQIAWRGASGGSLPVAGAFGDLP